MDLPAIEKTVIESFILAFGFQTSDWKLLHSGEGIVIEAMDNGFPVILKIMAGDDLHAVNARLNWIRYLHRNGLSVPEIIPTLYGQIAERVEVGGKAYSTYAYRKIEFSEENTIVWDRMPELAYRLGETMGKMHRLAADYQSETGLPAVMHGEDADWRRAPEQVIHPSQAQVIEAIQRLCQKIGCFPKTPTQYGLIHDDLHTGNVFSSHGNLVIIDFDCLHQSWFAADIASALLFRTWIGPEKEKSPVQAAAHDFLKRLIHGYRTQKNLPVGWDEMLLPFLKLREISLFQSFFRDVPLEQGLEDPFFHYVYQSIVMDRPFTAVDFSDLRLI